MAHDHQHARAGERHAGRLTAALLLLVGVLVAEVITAALTGSLALLSDAGHMLTDVVGIAMALAAIKVASASKPSSGRTYGMYRLEVLAALANALLLFGVAAYVLFESIRRFANPTDVLAGPMLVVAVIGLVANLVATWLLHEGAQESLNVRGAYLEALADLVGSVGVVVAAAVIGLTGWEWVDPLVAIMIGVWILPRTWKLGRDALRVLMQATPPHLDADAITADLAAIPGVVDVHDLHLWTLTSEMEVASVHLMVAPASDSHGVLDTARAVLADRYGIDHATLQVEPDDHRGCAEVSW